MRAIDPVLDAAAVMCVAVVDEPGQAVALAGALGEAGSPLIEITLRTPSALAAIEAVRRAHPDVWVGAGTVLDAQAYLAAAEAGASFAVSPGLTPALLEAAAAGPIPLLPGVASASEIMAGLAHGFDRFKFFPAEAAGGPAALKAFFGPFPGVRFCPTGGVTAANAAGYLALPNVACVGGSWLAPPDLLRAGRLDEVRRLGREAAALRR